MNDGTIEKIRANGWKVGDYLEGDEGFGPTVILITAIGEQLILARAVLHNGTPVRWAIETNWTLMMRDWKKVPNPPEVE